MLRKVSRSDSNAVLTFTDLAFTLEEIVLFLQLVTLA